MGFSEAEKNLLVAWAKHQPCITKVWLFGSRITEVYRDGSDLDVAIELHFNNGNESFNSQMIETMYEYRKELKILFNLMIDLQWYGGAEETPYIHKYITKKSILIYSKRKITMELPPI
jgi:predicted nucleotidyltransferase